MIDEKGILIGFSGFHVNARISSAGLTVYGNEVYPPKIDEDALKRRSLVPRSFKTSTPTVSHVMAHTFCIGNVF